MEAFLLFAIFFPILISPAFFILQKCNATKYLLGYLSAFIALIALFCVIQAGRLSAWNVPIALSAAWVPILGINLDFITDGLSLFFGILITAMGILVNLYAQYYMPKEDPGLGRFYCCLTFFMGAMIGTVFSINLIVLFLFWELTGLASFLLIGYHYQEVKACKSAITSLFVTSFASLALLAGIILLGQLYHTYNWMSIVQNIDLFRSVPLFSSMIILCFLGGILGKSAQFPFYFWLPKAMAAPTPVSAYLHAATMVNLGIFLIARMYPLFVTNFIWFPFVTSISFLTMFIGAIFSLLSNDLKALLAYATVSQLGFFIGFYGMGDEEGVSYDFVHILNHALYKGSLFMLVGIVQHATGIRDIRRLSGLKTFLPFTTILFFIAAGAMAGLPGTIGFLSKEMMLTDVVALGKSHHSGWIILGILFSASIFKVAFSLRIFYHLFIREKKKHHFSFHPPGLAVQIPPAILCIAAFILGVWPTGLNHLVEHFYVSGLHAENPNLIKIWHGWTIELAVSAGIIGLGILLFTFAEKTNWVWAKIPHYLHLDNFYKVGIKLLKQSSLSITNFIHPKQPSIHIFWLFALASGLLIWQLFPQFSLSSPFVHATYLRIFIGILIMVFSVCVLLLPYPLSQAISLSAAGFAITLYFSLYEAPDLAMTQILVEVATLFLLLLFLHATKHSPSIKSDTLFQKCWKMLLSLAMGFSAFLIACLYNQLPDSSSLKNFYLTESLPLAHGKNVVNTILVDFRGLDTLGEASVLLISCLGAISLLSLKRTLRSGKMYEADSIPSTLLKNILPSIFFLSMIFAFYLLIRGHNYPGGGFSGGLLAAAAIILLGIVNPSKGFFPIDPLKITFSGLSLILFTGLLGPFKGQNFLTHSFYLYTPFIFDTGVFFIVIGICVKIVFLFRKTITINRG